MQPLVSIIVPVYNVEQYINRAMNSLVNQTLKNIEIILVDDESPDRCPQICDEYAKNDHRIKVIHKKNGGLGFARNSGLDIAIGEYVMFVDSDDTIKLDTCEKFYDLASKYNADIVTGDFITEIKPGKWSESQNNGIKIYNSQDTKDYILDMIASAPHIKIERLHPVSVCLLFIKRKIIYDNNLRFKSEREVASEDTIFKISLLTKVEILIESSYNFYYYHINSNSLTHTFKTEDFNKLCILRNNLIEYAGSNLDTVERINRFIISDIRIQILRLVSSNRKDKIKIIRWMLNNDIWNELKTYNPNNYSIYPRIFYKLCLSRSTYLLYFFARIISFIKNVL